MIKGFVRACGILGCSLVMVMPVFGGPVDRSAIISEPAWVAHLDADALRASEVGKQLLVEMNKPEPALRFDVLAAAIGCDLRTALHGLTVYGVSSRPEDGVALVFADINAERLLTLAKQAEDYKSSAYGQDRVHSWIDAKKRARTGGSPRTYASIYDNRAIVFAQRESRLKEALDVLRKAKPALTDTTFPGFGTSEGGILQACARQLSIEGGDTRAAVLQMSKLTVLNVRESQGKAQASVALETGSEEAAQQVGNIVRGIIALTALQTNNPAAVKLARSLSVEQSGTAATVQLSVGADEIVTAIKADAAKKEARKAEQENSDNGDAAR